MSEESSIMDLDSLSIKLSEIADNLEKDESNERLKTLCNQLLNLFKNPDEFYYQISHGGSATVFRYFVIDLIGSCSKAIASIDADIKDITMSEYRKKIVATIRNIIRVISDDSQWRFPNPAFLGLYKPPEWMTSSNYFVSYSHKDTISKSLVPFLRLKLGFTINLWIDEFDLKRHEQIPKALSDAITKSNASILILSKNFFESKWCNEEWQALFMKRFSEPEYRVYIIRIDDEDYPPLLSPFYYTDCCNYPQPRAKVELGKLINEIENYELYTSFRRR